MDTLALALIWEPLLAGRAVQRRADASANRLVPYVVRLRAFLDETLELTGLKVECVVLVRWGLGFANAFASRTVPDHGVRGMGLLTVVEEVALAVTAFECPVVVLVARLLNADALASECVELLGLVVALPHLVATGAVNISIELMAPDELAIGAGNQGLRDAVDTWFKLTEDNCNSVLYFR